MRTLKPWGDAPQNYSYHLLKKAKGKTLDEVATFKVSGQCCPALAEKHCETEMGWPENFLWSSRDYKLVDGATWVKYQVARHLKEVGIRRKG